ncbi:MAG TPA: hypothetical protein VKF83_07060 [Stellaceae bacterium]|nr:hypothetical protein [Stellaceae bacterium]
MTANGRGIRAASLGLALAACAQLPPPGAPAQPSAGAVAPARDDTISRFVGLIGTRAQHAPPFLGVPETNFYCLRSFVDRQTGETRHQLYVSDSYSGAEQHWDAARDGAGRTLRFVEISRDQITCDGGCSYAEEFAADIPESELRANPQGLEVIFTARSGAEKTIPVSGSQIAAQIAATNAAHSPEQPAPAVTPSPPHQ